ncbi:hypothetical protein [Jiangella anatolica]|nr:hypothetical protein [Jiangella anatolica]
MVFRTLTTGAFLVGMAMPADAAAEPVDPPPAPADDGREPDAVAAD